MVSQYVTDTLTTPQSPPARHGSPTRRERLVRHLRRNWPLLITAAFAVFWIFHRAIVQSVTVDEANTYLRWVEPPNDQWGANSNNHILNTLLIRLSVWCFGLSHLSFRGPALLGGLIYIAAVYRFCTLCIRYRLLSWAIFLAFVYNPILMDYLVAARGYALAMAFLMVEIYLLARLLLARKTLSERRLTRWMTFASVSAGLAFCANFSFSFAIGLVTLAIFLIVFRMQRRYGRMACVRLAAAAVLPAAAIAFFLAGSILAEMPKDQLIWGTHHLSEMWRELRIPYFAEYTEFNTALVNPLLAKPLKAVRFYFLWMLALLTAVYVVLLVRRWRVLEARDRSRLRLSGTLFAIFLSTVLAHWLQLKIFKVLLPLERTSLFFVLLMTAAVAALFSVRASGLTERISRGCAIALLTLMGFYSLGYLRDSFFNTWRGQADVAAAFPVAVSLSRQAGFKTVSTDPEYGAILNFYRSLYKVADVEFQDEFGKMATGKSIYLIGEGRFREFIASENLKIVYRGPTTDLVIAVRQP